MEVVALRSLGVGGLRWQRIVIVAAAVALVLGGVACTPVMDPRISKLPSYAIDSFACEVTWQRASGEGLPSDAASRERVIIARHLAHLMRGRADLRKARPARFKVAILDRETSEEQYQVTLTFDVAGQLWEARGFGGAPKDGVMDALLKAVDAIEKNKKSKVQRP